MAGRLWRRVVDIGGSLMDLEDRLHHPILTARKEALKVPGAATVVGVASVPGNQSELGASQGVQPEAVLFRLDVRREDSSTFECGVLEPSAAGITRQVEPGLELAVRCHPSEPKAAADWEATAALHRTTLDWPRRDTILSWPDPDEWPARGAVEVRHRPTDAKRIDERRAAWRRETGRFVSRGPADEPFAEGRSQYTIQVDVGGHRLPLVRAVPALAIARLVESKDGQLVDRAGVPLVVLVDPADATQAEIDWEATLQQPEFRGLDNIPARLY